MLQANVSFRYEMMQSNATSLKSGQALGRGTGCPAEGPALGEELGTALGPEEAGPKEEGPTVVGSFGGTHAIKLAIFHAISIMRLT